MEDWSGRKVFAEYASFRLEPESEYYKLRLGRYHGNAGDSFTWHNGKQFTTLDRDHDVYTGRSSGVKPRWRAGERGEGKPEPRTAGPENPAAWPGPCPGGVHSSAHCPQTALPKRGQRGAPHTQGFLGLKTREKTENYKHRLHSPPLQLLCPKVPHPTP